MKPRRVIDENRHGPWFSNTWWGERLYKINVSIVVALLLFLLWKSFF